MKTKQKLFLGFAVIITVIFTIAGCALFLRPDIEEWRASETETFPEEFIGTWERNYNSRYTSTLTFTSTTLQASNQNSHWKLYYGHAGRYGEYVIHNIVNGRAVYVHKIKINLDENGNLFIVEPEDNSNNVTYMVIETRPDGSKVGRSMETETVRSEDDWNGSWKRKQ
ncbi:MAG: hypothetical protein LBI28_05815 [Treponema sp.]|jgi:hypothetical protein|nr:hypothetical protein [Treponema sp.]